MNFEKDQTNSHRLIETKSDVQNHFKNVYMNFEKYQTNSHRLIETSRTLLGVFKSSGFDAHRQYQASIFYYLIVINL
jgi:hypothetical protein